MLLSHRLLAHCLCGLGNQLLQLGIRLLELLRVVVLDVLGLLARPGLGDHDNGGGPLCCAGLAELCARLDVDVWDAVVFAENGDVGDDVHGRDVGGNDDDGGRVVDVGGVSRALRLTESLDDFLDTTAEGLGLRSCEVSASTF